MRTWLVMAAAGVMVLLLTPVEAGGTGGHGVVPHAAKQRPRKKSTAPASKRKPVRKVVNSFEEESNLHAERQAVMERMRSLNKELKDAELAAALGRLEKKEAQRHELAMRLLQLESEQKTQGDRK